MPSIEIGRLTSGKTKKVYIIKWNRDTGDVFVSHVGLFGSSGSRCSSKATSASDALYIAEGFLRNK